jgi:hypothetical protein
VYERLAIHVALLSDVYQNGKGFAPGTRQVEGNLVDETLHVEQGHELGVVEEPPANAQKVLDACSNQLLPAKTQPLQEGLVRTDDGAIGKRREIAARGALVELLSGLDQRSLVDGY